MNRFDFEIDPNRITVTAIVFPSVSFLPVLSNRAVRHTFTLRKTSAICPPSASVGDCRQRDISTPSGWTSVGFLKMCSWNQRTKRSGFGIDPDRVKVTARSEACCSFSLRELPACSKHVLRWSEAKLVSIPFLIATAELLKTVNQMWKRSSKAWGRIALGKWFQMLKVLKKILFGNLVFIP